ncbi:hypothetical protein V4R08_04615 [Nitrobacter sp. NHB1]|uniref:hypothetical protein n=1 Tax=Nitrobacter sp. NHB1 TaxID=3119830 RepID=UPI00300022E7
MRITAISKIKNPKTWENGDHPLAFFDVEFAGVRISKCLLVRTARGFNHTSPPKTNGERLVEFTEGSLSKAAADAAYNALLILGN